jgi:hypothetical protein
MPSGLPSERDRRTFTNAENLLVIQDPALADKYLTNWKVHVDHSEAYAGK